MDIAITRTFSGVHTMIVMQYSLESCWVKVIEIEKCTLHNKKQNCLPQIHRSLLVHALHFLYFYIQLSIFIFSHR